MTMTAEQTDHKEHIAGGYFKMGCAQCEHFVGKYTMSGRKFRIEGSAK